MKLSHSQMMALWRRAHGLEEQRLDCSVELFEGIALEAALASDLRKWYLNLLDTANPRFLTLTDISDRLTLTATGRRWVWRAELPVDVRRVFALVLDDGTEVKVLQPGDPETRAERLAANPYAAPCRAAPVARVTEHHTIMLTMRAQEMPRLAKVLAVTDPGDETFEFDESALSLLPTPLRI